MFKTFTALPLDLEVVFAHFWQKWISQAKFLTLPHISFDPHGERYFLTLNKPNEVMLQIVSEKIKTNV